jgi:hypothetical protein
LLQLVLQRSPRCELLLSKNTRNAIGHAGPVKHPHSRFVSVDP